MERERMQSVFVIIYSRKKDKIKTILKETPGMLTIFRKDGSIGFPGGRVETKDKCTNKYDTLKNAAIREVKEEIGYDITHAERLHLESETLNGNIEVYTYSYLVSDQELNEIYKNYYNVIGKSFNKNEVYGLIRMYFEYDNTNNILKQKFKANTKMEIIDFLKKHF